MSFWSTTTAAVRYIDTWMRPRFPHFLRILPAKTPHIPQTIDDLQIPVRLTSEHIGLVSGFWTANYGGKDWYLDAEAKWVETYLADEGVIVLGMFDRVGNLVATIVSCPIAGPTGRCEMSNGGYLRPGTMRIIEGLCVLKRLQNTGLAGLMIQFMDAWTSKSLPVAHLWARETAMTPFFSTALRTDVYALLKTRKMARMNYAAPLSVVSMDWSDFVKLWQKSFYSWMVTDGEGKKPPFILTTTPYSRSGHIDVWVLKKSAERADEEQKIVVVSNTRRRAVPGDERIFEVVWCGVVRNSVLTPNRGGRGFRPMIESVGAQYPNSFLFASSGNMGGQACSEWTKNGLWSYGSSGVHSWFVYNYMAPSYGNCEMYMIRDEI